MLSEKAEKIKSDLEHALYVNRKVENLKQKKQNLQNNGFPRGSSNFVDGGALNKTEEMYMAVLDACAKIDEEVLKCEAENCEILRKVNLLPSREHCMIYDRYFKLPNPTLNQLCRKYFYSDESNMNRVYNQIFEKLVWL